MPHATYHTKDSFCYHRINRKHKHQIQISNFLFSNWAPLKHCFIFRFNIYHWHYIIFILLHSVILIDEYEDFEEEDLNCEGEMEHFPSWEIDSDIGADVDVDADGDCDESTEDTALLQCATRTAIVITPISPVSSIYIISHTILYRWLTWPFFPR